MSLTIQLGAPENLLSLKDFVALLTSSAALVTSVTVAAFNLRAYFDKRIQDDRAVFDAAIAEIMKFRMEMEQMRRDLGDDFNGPLAFGKRNAIADGREFHLSRALRVLSRNRIDLSAADYMLVAATLIDSGRTAKSVPFYERGVARAADEYEQAQMLRVHGRALIAAGNYRTGREQMLASAALFEKISHSDDYDGDRAVGDVAETFRRLVAISAQKWMLDDLQEDINSMESSIEKITDPVRKKMISETCQQAKESAMKLLPHSDGTNLSR